MLSSSRLPTSGCRRTGRPCSSVGERPAPVEHLDRDPDLADVVDQRGHAQHVALGVVEAQRRRPDVRRCAGDTRRAARRRRRRASSMAAASVSRVSMSAFSRRKARPSSADWSSSTSEICEKSATMSRPERLANSRAASAAAMRLSRSRPQAGKSAMPMLIESSGRLGHVQLDLAHALGDALRQRRRLLHRRAGQDHDELLAAVARHEVARRARCARSTAATVLQRLVAARMPETVVHGLEEVEVHHEQREHEVVARWRARPRRPGPPGSAGGCTGRSGRR